MDALHTSPGIRPTVVVAGGGIAAAETLLALHALAGDRLTLKAVTLGRALSYKPLAVTEPFGGGAAPVFDLRRLCEACGAELVHGALDSVDPLGRHALLDDGHAMPYDALVVAVGARPMAWLDDAITVYGPGYTARLSGLMDELEHGEAHTVAFAVPPASGWTLPAYELALLTARRLERAGVRRRLILATPEAEPLALFGGEVSHVVAGLLGEAGVELVAGRQAASLHDGELRFVPHREPLAVDRVVTLPMLHGPALAGLPQDPDGFIPVDPHGRVLGETDVYAAGDVTAGALRQGGIAAQQADAVAAAIAARAGAPVEAEPFRPVLRGVLLTGGAPRHVRAEIAGGKGDDVEISEHALWWPPSKIAARHLGPYLAAEEHEALRALVPPGAIGVETIPGPG